MKTKGHLLLILSPDWSPDSYLNAFYIGSIYAARAGLVKKAINNIDEPLIMPWGKALFWITRICLYVISFLVIWL